MRLKLSVSGVSERDIDLLLLEEFVASPHFLHWFARQIGLGNDQIVLVSGRRSVTESIGESDVELSVETLDSHRCRILIENKIGAAFQPRQSERYRERGETYRARNECETFITVLVAPAAYLSGNERKGFDALVTYESVLDWFESQAALGSRAEYKLLILSAAIEKAVRGYQLVADAPVTNFWRAYWELARLIAPSLEMVEPVGKPAGAGFVYFRPPVLPQGVAIVHKLRHGFLDLQFAGMGSQLAAFHARFGDALLPGMTIARAAKSAVIRQKVPTFRTNEPFISQQSAAVAVLEKAKDLLLWFQAVGSRQS